MYLVNITARILGFILRIDHSLDKDFKTIVISKYVGLGSIIQATPLIQTLKQQFPSARIIFLSTSGNKALLDHIPEISETILIRDNYFLNVIGSSLGALRKLWKLKPQVFIDLEFYSNYSSIMTTLSLSKNRMGFKNETKRTRKGMYNHLVNFNIEVPISNTYLQFAELLNCKSTIKDLKIKTEPRIYQESILRKTGLNINENYLVINPNASDLRIERRWPAYSFIQSMEHLITKYGDAKLVLIGDRSEVNYVESIYNKLKDKRNVINTAGQLSLNELIALLSQTQLLLTNDTGPMHIAFACGTSSVTLFGPCSPLQYGGTKNTTTLYKKVSCSPCVHTHILPPCKGDNICMKQISIQEVCDAIDSTI